MQVAMLILKSGLLLCHTLFVILYVLYTHCSEEGMQRGNRAVEEGGGGEGKVVGVWGGYCLNKQGGPSLNKQSLQ